MIRSKCCGAKQKLIQGGKTWIESDNYNYNGDGSDIEIICQNCGKPFESEEKKTPPICACGREMKPAYDEIAKKVTGYQWSCECSPNLRLSIG